MMPLKLSVSTEMPANKESIYKAWLKGKQHAAITAEPTTSSTRAGGAFTAHGDYLSGKNLELIPFTRIVQTWRTTEFSDYEKDSILEVQLQDKGRRTLVSITHSNLPPHGTTYEQGWIDYYFNPMKSYFQKIKQTL
jgi:hypothetical protein